MDRIDIKALREAAGMSQRQLAKEMGISHPSARLWERGGQPAISKLPKLVRVFGLRTIDDLWNTPRAQA